MNVEAVRTFVAVADTGRFHAAADEIGITQQAVSRRIASLERDLEVRLFVRTSRGTRLSVDGQVFLPRARELLRAASRAVGSVRAGRRALRVDVLNRRTAPATALREFHRLHPDVEIDVLTLPDAHADDAVAAVLDGSVDATFRAFVAPAREPSGSLRIVRVIDDRHQLLVGPRHPLAASTAVTLADLRSHRIWMPGLRPDTEWGAYYEELARAFDLRIDTGGPSFGADALLEELAASADLSTFVGEGSRYLWPDSYDLRRIPIIDPTPVYPHSVAWRDGDRHPVLEAFLAHLHRERSRGSEVLTWVPSWARETIEGRGLHDRRR